MNDFEVNISISNAHTCEAESDSASEPEFSTTSDVHNVLKVYLM